VRRYPGCVFASPTDLAKHIAYTAILDLLVKDYASEAARARDVAEGFIREMAGKVARDERLDLDGMKQAVRNALDIYEKEIAGGQTQTNLDASRSVAVGGLRCELGLVVSEAPGGVVAPDSFDVVVLVDRHAFSVAGFDPPGGRARFQAKHRHCPTRGLRRTAIWGNISPATDLIFPGLPGHRPASQGGFRVSGAGCSTNREQECAA
jgi:hypothetical protein